MFLGMTLWFSATAVTPSLVSEFRMSAEQAAWLTIAVQAGFVVGTLGSAVANLADMLNARVLLFFGTLAGALANAAVLTAQSGEAVIRVEKNVWEAERDCGVPHERISLVQRKWNSIRQAQHQISELHVEHGAVAEVSRNIPLSRT